MKKIFTYLLAGLSLLSFSRCDSLDIEPTSSLAGTAYWKNPDQFTAFNTGLHALLREKSYNFFLLGEPRADIYGDNPIGGEASQGMERLPFNTIPLFPLATFLGRCRFILRLHRRAEP